LLPLLTRVSLVCTALLCAVPFLQPYHLYPMTSFYTEWLAFVLGIGVTAVLFARESWEKAEVPWVALLPFMLAALLIVHGVLGWSPYFGQPLLAALYLIWASVLIIAARALVQICGVNTVFTVVAAGLAAGALLSALIGIIQHFNLQTPINEFVVRPNSSAIFGNLAQPNHYGAYTTLGLLSMVYLYGRGQVVLAVAAVCAVPLLFVLGLSGSRSVWLYLIAAFGFAAWLKSASADEAGSRRLFVVCGALIVVHSVMQLLVGAGWFKPAERETVTAIERLFSGADSITVRIGLWHAAWSMAMEQPFWGIGWGAFAGRYFDFIGQGNTAPLGLYNNAHNILLQLFVETGILGVVLLLVPLTVWAVRVLRSARNIHLWWLLAMTGALAIHSLLEYPLWYAYFLGPAALLLGIAPLRGFTLRLARLGHVFAAAVMLVGSVNLALLWTDYRDFERLFRTQPNQSNSAEIVRTIKRLHQNTLLTPYVELAAVLPLPVEAQDLPRRLKLYEGVIRFSPLPELVYRKVLLLALASRLAEAQTLLAHARKVYPTAPAEFDRDLTRLAVQHPARILPLIESGPLRSGQ